MAISHINIDGDQFSKPFSKRVETYPAEIRVSNEISINNEVINFALFIEITPLGSGRSGLFSISISKSKISFKAFQEHMNAQTDTPCNIVINARSPPGISPKANNEPKKTPMSPVNELLNLNKVNHEPMTERSFMFILLCH